MAAADRRPAGHEIAERVADGQSRAERLDNWMDMHVIRGSRPTTQMRFVEIDDLRGSPIEDVESGALKPLAIVENVDHTRVELRLRRRHRALVPDHWSQAKVAPAQRSPWPVSFRPASRDPGAGSRSPNVKNLGPLDIPRWNQIGVISPGADLPHRLCTRN